MAFLLLAAMFLSIPLSAAEISTFGDRGFELYTNDGPVNFRIPNKFIAEVPEIRDGQITRLRTCISFPDSLPCYEDGVTSENRLIIVILSSPPMDHHFFSHDLPRSWRERQPASKLPGLKIVSRGAPEYFSDKFVYFNEKSDGGFVIITCYGEKETTPHFCNLSTDVGGRFGIWFSFSPNSIDNWNDIYAFVLQKILASWQH